MNYTHSIADQYKKVNEEISQAVIRSGRGENTVKLVVVTKMQSVEKIEEVIIAGATNLGENYADQAAIKIDQISHTGIEWHMIGHIQSRKADLVVERFDYVHTLDSLKIARRISEKASAAGKRMNCLIEINIGAEDSKSGYVIDHPQTYEQFIAELSEMSSYPGISLNGLMAMPPLHVSEMETRAYYQQMRQLLEKGKSIVNQPGWQELSMGTSSDYQLAIEGGATIVRIGTSIFGERSKRV